MSIWLAQPTLPSRIKHNKKTEITIVAISTMLPGQYKLTEEKDFYTVTVRAHIQIMGFQRYLHVGNISSF